MGRSAPLKEATEEVNLCQIVIRTNTRAGINCFGPHKLDQVTGSSKPNRNLSPHEVGFVGPQNLDQAKKGKQLNPIVSFSFVSLLPIDTPLTIPSSTPAPTVLKTNKAAVIIITLVEFIKKSNKRGSSKAAHLAKLSIRPSSYGLVVLTVYDNGSVLSPEALDEDLIEKSIVTFLAMAIIAAAPPMLINGYENVFAISEETEAIRMNPVCFDVYGEFQTKETEEDFSSDTLELGYNVAKGTYEESRAAGFLDFPEVLRGGLERATSTPKTMVTRFYTSLSFHLEDKVKLWAAGIDKPQVITKVYQRTQGEC